MTIDDQNAHPLYKDAHNRFLRAEEQQNIKAAAKYPEPLNPASWTAEGLADHAAQEAVDMLRYIEALKAKCEGVERENELLQDSIRSVIITLQGIEDGGCDDVQEFAREWWLRLSRNIWQASLKREEDREYETVQEAFDSMPKAINEPCTRRVRVKDGEVFAAEVMNWRDVVNHEAKED